MQELAHYEKKLNRYHLKNNRYKVDKYIHKINKVLGGGCEGITDRDKVEIVKSGNENNRERLIKINEREYRTTHISSGKYSDVFSIDDIGVIFKLFKSHINTEKPTKVFSLLNSNSIPCPEMCMIKYVLVDSNAFMKPVLFMKNAGINFKSFIEKKPSNDVIKKMIFKFIDDVKKLNNICIHTDLKTDKVMFKQNNGEWEIVFMGVDDVCLIDDIGCADNISSLPTTSHIIPFEYFYHGVYKNKIEDVSKINYLGMVSIIMEILIRNNNFFNGNTRLSLFQNRARTIENAIPSSSEFLYYKKSDVVANILIYLSFFIMEQEIIIHGENKINISKLWGQSTENIYSEIINALKERTKQYSNWCDPDLLFELMKEGYKINISDRNYDNVKKIVGKILGGEKNLDEKNLSKKKSVWSLFDRR